MSFDWHFSAMHKMFSCSLFFGWMYFSVLQVSCIWFMRGLLLFLAPEAILVLATKDLLATLLGGVVAVQMSTRCIGNGRELKMVDKNLEMDIEWNGKILCPKNLYSKFQNNTFVLSRFVHKKSKSVCVLGEKEYYYCKPFPINCVPYSWPCVESLATCWDFMIYKHIFIYKVHRQRWGIEDWVWKKLLD